MSLMERMGKTFTVTTELGPVKGALFHFLAEQPAPGKIQVYSCLCE
jgi:hypothetical protein